MNREKQRHLYSRSRIPIPAQACNLLVVGDLFLKEDFGRCIIIAYPFLMKVWHFCQKRVGHYISSLLSTNDNIAFSFSLSCRALQFTPFLESSLKHTTLYYSYKKLSQRKGLPYEQWWCPGMRQVDHDNHEVNHPLAQNPNVVGLRKEEQFDHMYRQYGPTPWLAGPSLTIPLPCLGSYTSMRLISKQKNSVIAIWLLETYLNDCPMRW